MESGEYNVQLVQTGTDVLASISSLVFDVAFLDGEIKDQPVELLIDAVRIKLPGIKVVVVPPAGKEDFPSAKELGADGLIKKPFYLPDLLSITTELINGAAVQKPEGPKLDMPFDDVVLPVTELATQEYLLEKEELVKWFSESTALAAIIVKGDQMIASVGEIADSTLHNLIKEVHGHLTPGSREELIQFSNLGATTQDRLIYATHLTSDLTGVLLYEVSTLFSSARAEAATLSQALVKAAAPQETVSTASGSWAPEEPGVAADVDHTKQEVAPGIERKPEDEVPKPEESQPQLAQKEEMTSSEILETSPAQINIATPEEVPFPWQNDEKPVEPTIPEVEAESNFSQDVPTEKAEPGTDKIPNAEITPDQEIKPVLDQSQPGSPEMAADVPAQIQDLASSTEDLMAGITPERPDLAKTATLTPASSKPPEDRVHQTFVLVPGDPKTFLVGELADDIAKWIPEICKAHDWQLDAIAIRPVYMQFTLEVPKSLPSGETIKIVRNESSNQVFFKYPSRRSAESGGDFWAEEHLEIDRDKPVSQHDLKIFINRMHG